MFLCTGRAQPTHKEKLMSERHLEIPGLGWHFPDLSTSPAPPKPQASWPWPCGGGLAPPHTPKPWGSVPGSGWCCLRGTQVETEHDKSNAAVQRASVSKTRQSFPFAIEENASVKELGHLSQSHSVTSSSPSCCTMGREKMAFPG